MSQARVARLIPSPGDARYLQSRAPLEPAAEDEFYEEVIGGAGEAEADTEIELPIWREV